MDTESREVTPSLRSSESEEIEAGEAEIFSGGNGSERSDQSAGSEVNITAIEEELDPAPHKGLIDKSEKAPHELPTGKFWMHDDRTEDDANNRWALHLLNTCLCAKAEVYCHICFDWL